MLQNNYKISLKFFRTFDETVFNYLIKSNKDKYKAAQRVFKLASAIFIKLLFFRQMIGLQEL